jgi:hypothetical protein
VLIDEMSTGLAPVAVESLIPLSLAGMPPLWKPRTWVAAKSRHPGSRHTLKSAVGL